MGAIVTFSFFTVSTLIWGWLLSLAPLVMAPLSIWALYFIFTTD